MTKKILVVEDDPINRQVLSDFLAAQGYATVVACDGAEGVRMFLSESPDLMIVDALLPLKSGFEVCFEVRRTPTGRSLPVLLMSAVCKDTHTAIHATADLHAQGYFIKPFKMRDLLRSVNTLLGEAS
jgi:two-component system alkaline phosphatase synthesis response regulator PhoP